MRRSILTLAAVSFVWATLPRLCWSQYEAWQFAQSLTSSEQAITGVGTVTLKRAPTALRMSVELVGKGKTMEEALAKLKDRREAAQSQLESLKVAKDSIHFSAPSLSNLASSQQQQFERMVRQQMAGRGRSLPKGLKVPQSIAVGCMLTAEWALKGDKSEGLLAAAHAIQQKVEAADLAGTQEAQKLSPEEAEVAEEMATMMRDSGEEPAQAGKPAFYFVARLPEAERAKAMADAFSQARAQAAELAQAAGIPLGPLVGLSGQGIGRKDFSEEGPMMYASRSNYLQRAIAQQVTSGGKDAENETFSTSADSLSFNFVVHAAFGLGKP